ncbi:hypothetical protein Pcinc_028547, partial [Petrolisthes cinctipes]
METRRRKVKACVGDRGEGEGVSGFLGGEMVRDE